MGACGCGLGAAVGYMYEQAMQKTNSPQNIQQMQQSQWMYAQSLGQRFQAPYSAPFYPRNRWKCEYCRSKCASHEEKCPNCGAPKPEVSA